MKVLAVDTSSKVCSVAIVEFNKTSYNVINFKNNDDEKTHSQKLMPMIEEIFKETKLSLNDIDLLSCCIGPGSFTGIRIGVSSLKAFSDVKNIPCTSVTSLESLAYNVEDKNKTYIVPIIDAKNENVYTSLFYKENDSYKPLNESTADNINNSLKSIKELITNNSSKEDKNLNIVFIGNGSEIYKSNIHNLFENCEISFSRNNVQSAVSLARCGYDKYLKGEYGNSNILSPLYLRKSQAERAQNGEK